MRWVSVYIYIEYGYNMEMFVNCKYKKNKKLEGERNIEKFILLHANKIILTCTMENIYFTASNIRLIDSVS